MNSTRRDFIKQSSLATLAAMGMGTSLLSELAKAAESTFQVSQGKMVEKDGWMVAETAAKTTIALPKEQDVIRIQGRVGTPKGSLGITFVSDTKKLIKMRMTTVAARVYWGKQKGKDFPDAALQLAMPGSRCNYYVRPKVTIYNEDIRAELEAKWDTLPAASAHDFVLELRRVSDEIQVWIDGQFLSIIPAEGTFTQCEISLSEGAALRAVKAEKAAAYSADMLPVPISAYPRAGAMDNATIKLSPDAKLPTGLALPDDTGASHIAIQGLGRIPAVSIDLQSYRWRVSAVDDVAEARIFSVPLATYSWVNILCAAEEDPSLSPSFTVRLTRYANSRGDAMADTVVDLSDQGKSTFNGNARRVGDVNYGAADARKTVPLWLVRVPLKNGQIQDLIYDDKRKNDSYGTSRYLDFELMDPLQNVEKSDQFPPPMGITDRIYYPGEVPHYQYHLVADPKTKKKHLPGDVRSGVHVFAAALEQSPAAMDVRANVPWLIFYQSDKPVLNATVKARVAGKYTVEWTFADVSGETVGNGSKPVTLAAGAVGTVEMPVNVDTGWYATRFRLLNASSEELINYQSSFVMQPPDTRRAGFESPYGTWWFYQTHGGEPNIEMVGPVLQRAGIRHTLLPDTLPEETTKKYQVTATQIPWKHFKGDTIQDRVDQYEQWITKNLQLWPSVTTMLVWHESGDAGAPFPPPELWGGTPQPLSADAEKVWQDRITLLTALAKMVRQKFPQVKLQYGNNGNSLGIIGELLRRKFPREYIDLIGSEDLGQVIIPEAWRIYADQDSWFLRQLTQKMGYGDIPVTAAYEYIGRRAPTLGLKDQAEFTVRDALHGLSYGYKNISLNLVQDAGDGYFYSIWGASGLCRRYPRLEPRPVYAALAAHTRVLDSATYVRSVPAGSLSLYVMEFQRGKEWIYAVWTPRGEREITVRFDGGSKSTFVDLYGREKTLNGSAQDFTVSTAVSYLVSDSKIAEITPGKSSFPDALLPKSPLVVNPLEKMTDCSIAQAKVKENLKGLPHVKMGNFELRQVDDVEKGACLELEMKPVGDVWEYTQEYTGLQLNQPVAGTGNYQNVGVWVKGNSGWGEIKFEVTSDKGSFIAQSILFPNWYGMDAIDFDGWNFLHYPLGNDGRWSGKGTVISLQISMCRKALHLTEIQPVTDLKIRLKDVVLF